MSNALTVIGDGARMLAALSTPAEARALESLAAAARRYADSLEARNYAAEIQLRAGRRGGQMLIQMAETGERAKNRNRQNSESPPVTLAGLGIEPMRSSRWQALARQSATAFEAYIERTKANAEEITVAGAAHVSQNAGDSEWFTPARYIEAAVRVMGGIDLDPASTAVANEVVGAETFYSLRPEAEGTPHFGGVDGLTFGWRGRVWMNPPYAQPAIWHFCEKLSEEVANGNVTEACALVNNASETVWFQRMAEVAKAICFPSGRVKFWHPDKESAPLQGQAVLYFGENVKAFCTEFADFGFTVAVVG